MALPLPGCVVSDKLHTPLSLAELLEGLKITEAKKNTQLMAVVIMYHSRMKPS